MKKSPFILLLFGLVLIVSALIFNINSSFETAKHNNISITQLSFIAFIADFMSSPSAIIGIICTWVALFRLRKEDRIKNANRKSRMDKVIKGFGIITLILFFLTIFCYIKIFIISKGENKSKNNYAIADPMDNLSSIEKARFREILREVMRDENFLTPEIHQEFWKLLDKTNPSDNDLLKMRDTLTGVTTIYMKYFYEDALESISQGRAFKSKQTEDYEKRLLQLGAITEFRIKDNEYLMVDIAQGKPIKIDANNELVLTKDGIETILTNLDKVNQRINSLLTR